MTTLPHIRPSHRHAPAVARAGAIACALAVMVLQLSGAFASAWAQESGGTDTVFRLGPTARGVGLAGAMVGLATDASAPYWNPALLPHAPGSQITFSYNRLFSAADGAAYQYLGMVYPTLNAGGFGLGFLRLSLGGIDTYDNFSRPTGTLDYAETQMLFSYGYGAALPWLGGHVDLGLTAKIHSLELDERATSGGMDLAVSWQPPHLESFRVSYVHQNLVAPSFRLVDVEDQQPFTQRFALSHHRDLGEATTLDLAVDYDRPQFADSRLSVGGEFSYRNLYTLRAGYDSERFSVGLGGRWRAYALDYAFRSGGELGASQFLSFSWYFGESLKSRRDAQARQRQQEIEEARMEAVESWRSEQAMRALEDLRGHLAGGAVDRAEQDLARARGFGVAESELSDFEEILKKKRQQQQEQLLADQLRQSQAQSAERAVREALGQDDPLRARLALENLQRVAPDHPMLSRLSQDVEAILAGAVAAAASEATAAERAGDWERALRAWSEVARLDPTDPGPAAAQARWRAELEAARTDSEQARAQADRARRQLQREETYTQALERYAQGDLDGAETLCKKVLAADPSHRKAAELLRRIQLRREGPRRLSGAEEEEVRKAYLAGLTRFTEGDYEGAIAQWEKILQIDPGNQGARNNIAEAKARMESLRKNKNEPEGGSR